MQARWMQAEGLGVRVAHVIPLLAGVILMQFSLCTCCHASYPCICYHWCCFVHACSRRPSLTSFHILCIVNGIGLLSLGSGIHCIGLGYCFGGSGHYPSHSCTCSSGFHSPFRCPHDSKPMNLLQHTLSSQPCTHCMELGVLVQGDVSHLHAQRKGIPSQHGSGRAHLFKCVVAVLAPTRVYPYMAVCVLLTSLMGGQHISSAICSRSQSL